MGGGFPETQMETLTANTALRNEIRNAIVSGLPTYAECGGLMYLCRSITWGERRCEMAGVIPADVVMHGRPQGRGYVRLQDTGDGLWPNPSNVRTTAEIAGHEFHYSKLDNVSKPLRFAYRMLRGAGVDGKHDGIVLYNMLACYCHQRHTRGNPWARRFVDFVRQYSVQHGGKGTNQSDGRLLPGRRGH